MLPILFIPLRVQAAVTHQTVALSGNAATGILPGTSFSNVFQCLPRIDSSGRIGFGAYLTGNDVDATNNLGFWFGAPGDIHPLMRTGQPASGYGPGVSYNILGCLAFTKGGYSAIAGTVAGSEIGTYNENGLWYFAEDRLTLVAHGGDGPPGAPDGVYQIPRAAGVSSSGVITFTSELGGLHDVGIWSGTPGSLQLLSRTGMSPPLGTGPFILTDGRSNDAGDLLFTGHLGNTDGPSGIWLKSGGITQLVALTSSQAPELPVGTVLSGFSPPRLSESAIIAFWGVLAGDGVTQSNNTAIWAGRPGALHLLAREGTQAPDASVGTVIKEVLNHPVLNRSGHVAFTASIEGGVYSPGDMGLWIGPPSNPRLIVDTATPLISTPFGDLEIRLFISEPAINSSDDVAFYALLEGPRVTSNNNHSLWVRSHDGTLLLIAREGDSFDVGVGDTRIIKSVLRSTVGMTDPTAGDSYFNDAGQLVFELAFTDGSAGIFMATIPEPVFLSPLALLACYLRRRRRP